MADDAFDLIIVGGGVAGLAAAYTAAKAGLETLLVERGNFAGAKNMTGGRLYAHSLAALIPEYAKEAPLERCATRERVSFLTAKDAATMEYATTESPDFANRSYTVLRARFDQWLAEKAEEAGAQIVPGTRVDSLIIKDGAVRGIRAGDEELEASAVILADGANSLLAANAGLISRPQPKAMAVGVKETLEFSPAQMRERFGCVGDEGMAWLFAGSPTDGKLGGGFLYTNKESVSLGLVFGLSGIAEAQATVPEMLEKFKSHPAVAPLLDGGKLVEYSAHLVPEGGLSMIPKLVFDGLLIAGDAAGLCVNAGYTIRGMDLAIASGRFAAEAVIAAKKKGDFGEASLAAYISLLQDSFVMKAMRVYSKLPKVLESERLFGVYPEMVCGIMGSIFTVDGEERPMRSKIWQHARKAGPLSLLADGARLMGAI